MDEINELMKKKKKINYKIMVSAIFIIIFTAMLLIQDAEYSLLKIVKEPNKTTISFGERSSGFITGFVSAVPEETDPIFKANNVSIIHSSYANMTYCRLDNINNTYAINISLLQFAGSNNQFLYNQTWNNESSKYLQINSSTTTLLNNESGSYTPITWAYNQSDNSQLLFSYNQTTASNNYVDNNFISSTVGNRSYVRLSDANNTYAINTSLAQFAGLNHQFLYNQSSASETQFGKFWYNMSVNNFNSLTTNWINGSAGNYIDMGIENPQGFVFSDTSGTYPDFTCKGNAGTNVLCEFPNGAYVSGSNLYITNGLISRGNLYDDTGVAVEILDNVTISGNLTIGGNLNVRNQAWNKSGTNVFQNSLFDRVGINTSTPTTHLDVMGNVNISGNLYVDAPTFFVDRINNRVGIGTTVPQSTLDILSGEIRFPYGIWHVTQESQKRFYFADTGTTYFGSGDGYEFQDMTNLKWLFNILNDGRVGIGTRTPSRALDVRGIGNFSGNLYIGNQTLVNIWMYNQTTTWSRSGTNVILNNLNDNVGIGTSTPVQKLDIAGSIKTNMTGDSIGFVCVNAAGVMFRNEISCDPA